MINCLQDCPDFGKCCRAFQLKGDGGRIPRNNLDKDQANEALAGDDRTRQFEVDFKGEDDEWMVRCIAVLEDGHCGIYDMRPQLCRDYLPGQDGLCCLHEKIEEITEVCS